MASFCTACGAQLPEGAAACPACGRGVGTGGGPAVAPATTTTGGLTDNVAGALAYVTIIPAIVFLVMDPYNKNRFIRFHSFQSIFLAVACFALGIIFSILGAIPVVNLLMIPVGIIVWIGIVILVIVLILKAYQGQTWKIPKIGDMAEKQANAV